MRDLDEIRVIAQEALQRARDAGAHAAEAYIVESESQSIGSRGDFVEPKEGVHAAIGMRVAIDGRLGHSGTSGLSGSSVRAVAQNAVEAARRGRGTGGFRGFPREAGGRVERTAPHPALERPDADRLAGVLQSVMEPLRSDARVTFRAGTVACSHRRFFVANSEGLEAWDVSAGEALQLAVRVERGGRERTATDAWAGAVPAGDAVDLGAFASDTAERALAALDAQPLTGRIDAVAFVPQAAAQVLGLFTPALSARRVQRDQSPLAGRMGAAVAAGCLSLHDRPHGPEGSRRMAVDHEGVPTQAVTLIDAGRLAGLLHDHDTAQVEDRPSNGHGLRANVGGEVQPRLINPVVDAGDHRIEELLATRDRVVLVPEHMMGSVGANATTGDFSFIAPFAFLYEHGRLRHALPPTTVAGNAHRVLMDVVALSRERRSIAEGVFPHVLAGGVACAT